MWYLRTLSSGAAGDSRSAGLADASGTVAGAGEWLRLLKLELFLDESFSERPVRETTVVMPPVLLRHRNESPRFVTTALSGSNVNVRIRSTTISSSVPAPRFAEIGVGSDSRTVLRADGLFGDSSGA